MINEQTYDVIPEFCTEGEKVLPSVSKQETGYLVLEGFPAQHANKFFNNFSKNGNLYQPALTSIIKELNYILSEMGVSPNPAEYNQIITALNNLYLKKENNLSDLPDKAVSRNNLNVYSKEETKSLAKYLVTNVYTDTILTNDMPENLLLNCFTNVSQYGILNIYLPDIVFNTGKRVTIKAFTGNGIVKVNGTMLYKAGSEYSFFKLFNKGDLITVFSDGDRWVVEKIYSEIKTARVNRSDWTNTLIGNAIIIQATRGGTNTANLSGQVLSYAVGNSFLCVYDGGNFLAFHNITNGGVIGFNTVLTSSDGTTVTVGDTPNTKNKTDRNFWHDTGLNPYDFRIEFNLYNTALSDPASLVIPYSVSSALSNVGGSFKNFSADKVHFQFRTGSQGVTYIIDDTGTANIVTSQDIFCEMKLIVEK